MITASTSEDVARTGISPKPVHQGFSQHSSKKAKSAPPTILLDMGPYSDALCMYYSDSCITESRRLDFREQPVAAVLGSRSALGHLSACQVEMPFQGKKI